MKLTLRKKLLLFSVAIAVLPLLIAGETLIRIARDELKSSANDQLTATVRQVSETIDNIYRDAWLSPLSLIANAIDDDSLGIDAKIAMLTLGIADLPDIVALQITVEGSERPLLVTREGFSETLQKAGLDANDILRMPPQTIADYLTGKHAIDRQAIHPEGSGVWLATLILPLKKPLNGRPATLSARVDLSRLKDYVLSHAFTRTGTITIVDSKGKEVLGHGAQDLSTFDIVREATNLLALQAGVTSVTPYARPNGEFMLGAFAFPRPFDWAVIAEQSEAAAYFTIDVMVRNLLLWVGAGLAVAGLGAVLFSLGISRPILKIGQAVIEVGQGNFQARVDGVKSRDEIGDLATRINDMIVQINERFQLAKFVSHGTIDAIKGSDQAGVRLGGSRKRVAILFADIRGYTAFSESREPEVVVEVLNHYFANQGEAVSRNNGDIDKFVGDQLMAIFQGPDMSADALKCAAEIQDIMEQSAAEHPDWQLDIGIGIDVGDVVVGAMGSPERMDYTVLGDHVNLSARLCSAAAPKQTMISDAVFEETRHLPGFAFPPLEPIRVKGKASEIKVYGAERSAQEPPAEKSSA
ncbi:adenylate/guanylate cyclase domain-containing protein [Roseibium polysiphoniae]|uniref:adenylate/guanylate cyclase domain-containing protein n=1 Tax=Roseibium polysiphoniae TaxID=2571221 RepID=UPI0032983E32